MGKKQKRRIKALEELFDALQNEFFNLSNRVAKLEAQTLPITPTKRPSPYEAPVVPLTSPWTCTEEAAPTVSMSNEMDNELREGMSPWQQANMDNMATQSGMVDTAQGTVPFNEYQKMFLAELDRNAESYFHAGGENWPMGAPKTNSEGEE